MTIEDDDIVMREFRAPRKAIITIGQAASEYFDWCERREQQRERRARMLAEIGEDASPPKKTSPPFDKNARIAVTQFVSHVTPGLAIAELTPHGMAAFQETIGTNAADVAARLLPGQEVSALLLEARLHRGQLGQPPARQNRRLSFGAD